MADSDDVTVEGDEETTVEDGDTITTVVVETPSSEEGTTDVLVDIVERVTRLEGRVDSVEIGLMEANGAIAGLAYVEEVQNEVITEQAEVTAALVEEEISEEAAQDEESVDSAPISKIHRWWRSKVRE